MVNATTKPIYLRELPGANFGWVPGLVWTSVKILLAWQGFDPRFVNPVASRYTDYAISAELPSPCRRSKDTYSLKTDTKIR